MEPGLMPNVASWSQKSLRLLRGDLEEAPETPVREFPLPREWNVRIFVKDESCHPTGSLKHRLARALFIDAIGSGSVSAKTTIVEASSGSTAIAEAYFASLLGLEFIAVVPTSMSPDKVKLVESYGGVCHFVEDAARMRDEAQRLAEQPDFYFIDQFSHASRVTDWESPLAMTATLFRQLKNDHDVVPSWIVVGAGTGGTATAFGRYTTRFSPESRVAIVDPQGSAFFDCLTGEKSQEPRSNSRIEGIGRTQIPEAFQPSNVKAALRVDDQLSVAAMQLMQDVGFAKSGPSSGTNLIGALRLAVDMVARGEAGSVVTLICDQAERYGDTYYSSEWLEENGLETGDLIEHLRSSVRVGAWLPDAVLDVRYIEDHRVSIDDEGTT